MSRIFGIFQTILFRTSSSLKYLQNHKHLAKLSLPSTSFNVLFDDVFKSYHVSHTNCSALIVVARYYKFKGVGKKMVMEK